MVVRVQHLRRPKRTTVCVKNQPQGMVVRKRKLKPELFDTIHIGMASAGTMSAGWDVFSTDSLRYRIPAASSQGVMGLKTFVFNRIKRPFLF